MSRFLTIHAPSGIEEFAVLPGESDRAAMERRQRQRLAARLQASPPAKPAKPVPSKTAPVGSREWAACLIQEFGDEQGSRFIGRELTYAQAVDQAASERAKLIAPATSSAGDGTKSHCGFASKIRFGGGMNVFKKA